MTFKCNKTCTIWSCYENCFMKCEFYFCLEYKCIEWKQDLIIDWYIIAFHKIRCLRFISAYYWNSSFLCYRGSFKEWLFVFQYCVRIIISWDSSEKNYQNNEFSQISLRAFIKHGFFYKSCTTHLKTYRDLLGTRTCTI